MKHDSVWRYIFAALLIVSILIGAFTAFLLWDNRQKIADQINSAVSEKIAGIDLPEAQHGTNGRTPVKGVDYFDGKDGGQGPKGGDGKNGEDGYTPIKGVDYFDGKDGEDGKDGKDGVDGTNGVDAPFYYQRCNESKDRWEYQYSGDTSWGVVMNENGEPAKCKRKGAL